MARRSQEGSDVVQTAKRPFAKTVPPTPHEDGSDDGFDDGFDDDDEFDDEGVGVTDPSDSSLQPSKPGNPAQPKSSSKIWQRMGMNPEQVAQDRAERARIQDRRSVRSDSMLNLALDGQDARFKAKVYELVVEMDIDPDDSLFLMLIATGRLEVLMEEYPAELGSLFDQWEERLYSELQAYKEGLEKYERTAVRASEKAISKTVESLIRKASFDKFVHSFTVMSVGLAVALSLAAIGLGLGIGYRMRDDQAKAVKYAVDTPRKLTVDEFNALTWALSPDGIQAKNLLDWNKDLLAGNACESQAQAMGLTLTLQGQKAQQGACVLWVRSIAERKLSPIVAPKSKTK